MVVASLHGDVQHHPHTMTPLASRHFCRTFRTRQAGRRYPGHRRPLALGPALSPHSLLPHPPPLRRPATRGDGFPRSHGPAKDIVNHEMVNVRLTSLRLAVRATAEASSILARPSPRAKIDHPKMMPQNDALREHCPGRARRRPGHLDLLPLDQPLPSLPPAPPASPSPPGNSRGRIPTVPWTRQRYR